MLGFFIIYNRMLTILSNTGSTHLIYTELFTPNLTGVTLMQLYDTDYSYNKVVQLEQTFTGSTFNTFRLFGTLTPSAETLTTGTIYFPRQEMQLNAKIYTGNTYSTTVTADTPSFTDIVRVVPKPYPTNYNWQSKIKKTK